MFEAPRKSIDCRGRILDLEKPAIVGIINVTPDSFSDGGEALCVDAAVARGAAMIEAGAHALDIGGESTRPGAQAVDENEELRRVIPVIEALAASVAVPISIDTQKPAVMRAAVAAGAGWINDVNALRAPGALDAAADTGAAVTLMHMQGTPATMQSAPYYDDVVGEVQKFLTERVLACQFAGIDKKRIVLDPGFGFGKALEHNLTLLAELERLQVLGCPLLVGLSRKRMIGTICGRDVAGARVVGSAAAALIAVQRGALIVRVHDVAATSDALAMWAAVKAHVPVARPAQKPAIRWPDDDE